MSMRVFYAYMYKDHADFSDVYGAQRYLSDIREKFIEWAASDMLRWPSLLSLDHFDRMRRLEADTKDPTIGGIWDYQLQCSIFCRTFEGVNYIVLHFAPSRPAAKFLSKFIKLPEFWYQDQVDNEDGVPDDYELRSMFWNSVYEKCQPDSVLALSYDIYDGNNFDTTCRIISELERLESKTKQSTDQTNNINSN